ncbi:hypothetical protein CKM354_000080800 [Cercospora kikuchii]|uniref:F-box domain-containing protein n=1 Tax=Cercospora kikuchii TaxID=84275 RepID=A0A9P3C6R5_9PEZI|nr:uncharacterized protein CKM354_000080800 [Cercospora kikuchii]GIZ37358.1 hypothetical protein CKM354_000080800 [Cercospora kikuchii]
MSSTRGASANRGRGGRTTRGGRGKPGGARGTFFEELDCGEHSIERYKNTRGTTKDRYEIYRRETKRGEKRGECICDYYSYPALEYERTSLGEEYKALPQSKIFPFFRLPAEIRNKIYEHLFILDQPIELCPDPFFYSYRVNKHLVAQHSAHHYAHDYQTKFFDENVQSVGPLMRLNKQFHKEVSPIFYGQNVFSFSNVAGWVCLDFFMYKIGLDKCGMIRKLIVCHPDATQTPGTLRSAEEYRQASIGFTPMDMVPIEEPGFVYAERWFYDYVVGKDPTLILNKLGKLEKFGVTFPMEVHIFDYDCPTTLPIDPSKFHNLEITLFRLTRHFPYATRMNAYSYQVSSIDVDRVAAEMSASADDYPVRAVTAKVHDQGRYATGFIEDLNREDELAEIEAEETEIVATRDAEFALESACNTPLPGDSKPRSKYSRRGRGGLMG